MRDMLDCPRCRRKLRVPPELQGQPVQCPACRLVFVPASEEHAAPPAVAASPDGPPEPRPQPASRPSDDVEEADDGPMPEPIERALREVAWPAAALILVGVLGMALNLREVVSWSVDPDKMQQRFREESAKVFTAPQFMPPVPHPGVMKFVHMMFTAMSLTILLSALRMRALASYPLAIVGSLLAAVNVNALCCFNLPIGIWSFIVLMRPHVRDAFE